jgi:hypothetical protein
MTSRPLARKGCRAAQTAWYPLADVLPGNYVGSDAIMGLFARMQQETNGTFRSIPAAMAAAGDRVFVEANVTGSRNGKELAMPLVMVFLFSGMELLEVRLHANEYPKFAEFWS